MIFSVTAINPLDPDGNFLRTVFKWQKKVLIGLMLLMILVLLTGFIAKMVRILILFNQAPFGNDC